MTESLLSDRRRSDALLAAGRPGEACRSAGRPAEAAAVFQRLTSLAPDNPKAWCALEAVQKQLSGKKG